VSICPPPTEVHRPADTPDIDPHLYYHGGDIRICRWFSRFIALQVQADVLGIPLEVYKD